MYDTIQKTIAAWAFNHYIAYYYFDNVNVSQLKVAFEKGEVELENLPIKKDALQHFNLPTMDVVSGIVGSLSIKVPLLTLLTDPWVIKINNLMLIVAPKKVVNTNNINGGSSVPANPADDNANKNTSDQSRLDLIQESSEISYVENNQDSSILEDDTIDDGVTNSEETKLAEFYSSFSSTVSSMVRDIYKNIRLEVESMTILFEDFDHGLVKFNVDKLLLHRPKALRSLVMDNVSIYLSSIGTPSSNEGEDLLRINLNKCNLDIYDETSNNMQLVVVNQPNDSSSGGSSSLQPQQTRASPPQPATTSETKFEGNFKGVSIEQLTGSNRRGDERSAYKSGERPDISVLLSKRSILECDNLKIEFKLNNNVDDELVKPLEKNLHIKMDLVGMQYIHSQQIYEITTHRLKNLLKFFIKLQTKPSKDKTRLALKKGFSDEHKDSIRRRDETSFNKLLILNIEEGLVYVVEDTSSSCAIPLLELSLDDCRILQFSGNVQQNGFVFAKIGCSYYNRKVSTWDTLLKPWPFNISWDSKSAPDRRDKNVIQHKQISLTSDEIAELVLSSAFLELCDLALKPVIDDLVNARARPIARRLYPINQRASQDFNSIFVLHNETGHKLKFAPLEQYGDLFELNESSKSTPTIGVDGDAISPALMHKLSLNSRSSTSSRDSPDLHRMAKWISVDAGDTVSFEYETLPIYRRRIIDLNARSRSLLVRVEGWKTLNPISVDKTGMFFREACSDMIMNEDIYIVISIDLEESSARKIISVRSPFNLVNLLDATLEVHFVESNHALYIKPESHLPVPLPYLFNQMRIRPCNVGVTMSEKSLSWDNIQSIFEHESNIHICNPISVTDMKHASYCSSQPYRICVSTQRDGPGFDETSLNESPSNLLPAFTMSFIPPLTMVNLLPCKLQYFIGEVNGTLNKGAQQRIYHVDTTKTTEVRFKINGYPQSKAINIDPGATGSFNHRLEMFDKKNRSLYLNAKIVLSSLGEEPAVQVSIYAPYWFINKTRLPLIFKQEGAALEAAGQGRENEESASPFLLFSFYDNELELPWLCSMRLGKSKGLPMWCDGFKLEKGTGERRVCSISKEKGGGDSAMNKSLIDINIRRGFGRYSETMIVTFTARYGFNPLSKTPKKASDSSPHNYKLTSYNHNVNLAERIAGQAVSLFNSHKHRGTSDLSLMAPGFKLTLVDNSCEKFIEASVSNIAVKCTTKAKEQILDCSVQDIRIDNLLPDCEKGVMLDRVMNLDESINVKPAIRLIMDRILGNPFGTTLFHQVQLSMCDLVLNIEEKLVLKLVEFISFRNRGQRQNMNNLSHDLDRILHPEEDRMSKYYFDLLRIDLGSLKLSVFTATTLTQSLQKLKSLLNLKFFSFEEAQVQLAPYLKMNVSKTFRGVFESVTRFYKRQIMEQAPRIVGQQIQNYLRFHLSDMLSTIYDEVYNKLFN